MTEISGARERIKLLVAGVAALASLFAGAAERTHRCAPTLDPQVLNTREQQLRETAERLLDALRSGDQQRFLRIVHPAYFGMGEGNRTYSRAELEKSFQERDWMFCYLFDSSCIAPLPAPARGKELSFHEAARRQGARVRDVEVWRIEGQEGCKGHATLTWPTKLEEGFELTNSRFTFMYKKGEWRVVGFSQPVLMRPRE